MKPSSKKCAVIIGAGPAGLTAAYQVFRELPDWKVMVFEAEDRIGGISTTIEHSGNWIDIGGHRFFSKNSEVNKFWQSLMPLQGKGARDDLALKIQKDFAEDGPDPETEDAVMLTRTRVSRIFYRRRFFDYPISIKPATFINMGLVNTIKAGSSYLYSSLKKREEKSLEDFYANRFGMQLYRMFFENYTEKVWGIHPSGISASWGAQRVKELSVSAIIAEAFRKIVNPRYTTNQTSLIDRFMYPKRGPGQLWSICADKVKAMGAEIMLDACVTGVHAEGGTVKMVAITQNGKTTTVPCNALFSSMAVKDLIAAMGKNVPQNIQRIARELPYRDFITVGLLVKKLLLKNKTKTKTINGIVPDCWIYIQERDVKIGRLQIFNNWSPYMTANWQNAVWIGLEYFCNEGDTLWNMDKNAFIKFAIDELAKINIIDKTDVLDAVQIKIKKAYPAYFGSYSEIDKVQSYLDTFDNLYCIGRNGQHKYNNMDHSMLTAVEAVKSLKSGGTDKRAIWNVNSEEEYHEEK
jgi:protoporphyrinogen oxidase